MAGTVKLEFGDMFGGVCDAIILPCATYGGVSTQISRRVKQHKLSPPPVGMKLGEVRINLVPQTADAIAQFVMYAASVYQLSLNARAIKQIGERIGEFTIQTSSARVIASPLLGTGAGKLFPAESFEALRDGFLRKASPQAVLFIYTLSEEVMEELDSA